MKRRMVDVEIKIKHETEKAYLVENEITTSPVWIPKLINGEEYEVDEGERGWAVITVPEWWATEKGIV